MTHMPRRIVPELRRHVAYRPADHTLVQLASTGRGAHIGCNMAAQPHTPGTIASAMAQVRGKPYGSSPERKWSCRPLGHVAAAIRPGRASSSYGVATAAAIWRIVQWPGAKLTRCAIYPAISSRDHWWLSRSATIRTRRKSKRGSAEELDRRGAGVDGGWTPAGPSGRC